LLFQAVSLSNAIESVSFMRVLLSVSGFLEDAERRAGRKSRSGHILNTGAQRMERAGD